MRNIADVPTTGIELMTSAELYRIVRYTNTNKAQIKNDANENHKLNVARNGMGLDSVLPTTIQNAYISIHGNWRNSVAEKIIRVLRSVQL